jgi:hypothetical protein
MPNHEHTAHARTLRADIVAAPDVWLPRREILLTWLDGFLTRSARASYQLEDTEAADLRALDQFLRKQKVPVA